jgi:hypothetical protein
MMPTSRDEYLIRAAFGPARDLEPSEADIARVLARANKPTWRTALSFADGRRRLVAVGLTALILLAGGAYAVPPTRAALDDLASTFDRWLSGNDASAPGRPLGANEDAPAYFHSPRDARDPRVIAEADGYKLYVALQSDGSVEFDLGNTGVGLGFEPSSFTDRALYVLGPGSMQHADEHGHVPLFGATARSVKSVELLYESGPALRADASHGGFVLLAEPSRQPREVVAYNANGEMVARELVDDSDHYGPRIDWQQFGSPAPRVSSECQPGFAGPNPAPPCPAR